jgi:uncharacterized protein (DUF1697 family)
MTRYVALLRGIGPTNPNMRGEKLRGVFEAIGFKKVVTVIGSGNVVFDSASKSTRTMETMIEKALPQRLGFTSTSIIRNKKEFEQLVKSDPFKNVKKSQHNYLIVTFLKREQNGTRKLPHKGTGYSMLGLCDRTIASVIDRRTTKTPDIMRLLEKEFGKDITTRTWQTIGRILQKM